MKYLVIILPIFLFAACTKSSICTDVNFDEEFTIAYGEMVCFPDGQSLEILDIRDEYCPCEAVCVWAGDLFVEMKVVDTEGVETIKILGEESFDRSIDTFTSVTLEEFFYEYTEGTGILPDCENTWDAQKVKLLLTFSI